MSWKKFKEFNECLFISKKTNYRFNKLFFYIWLIIVISLLVVILTQFGDYKEVSLSCNDVQCFYNNSFLEDETYYILDTNVESISTFDIYLRSGEYITYATYEKTPHLIENYYDLIFSSLIATFLINHVWFILWGKK